MLLFTADCWVHFDFTSSVIQPNRYCSHFQNLIKVCSHLFLTSVKKIDGKCLNAQQNINNAIRSIIVLDCLMDYAYISFTTSNIYTFIYYCTTFSLIIIIILIVRIYITINISLNLTAPTVTWILFAMWVFVFITIIFTIIIFVIITVIFVAVISVIEIPVTAEDDFKIINTTENL